MGAKHKVTTRYRAPNPTASCDSIANKIVEFAGDQKVDIASLLHVVIPKTFRTGASDRLVINALIELGANQMISNESSISRLPTQAYVEHQSIYFCREYEPTSLPDGVLSVVVVTTVVVGIVLSVHSTSSMCRQ